MTNTNASHTGRPRATVRCTWRRRSHCMQGHPKTPLRARRQTTTMRMPCTIASTTSCCPCNHHQWRMGTAGHSKQRSSCVRCLAMQYVTGIMSQQQVAPLWFAAQFTFNMSLAATSVTSNTILSSTSSLFTFGLSVLLLGEAFTLGKLVSIVACMAGRLQLDQTLCVFVLMHLTFTTSTHVTSTSTPCQARPW